MTRELTFVKGNEATPDAYTEVEYFPASGGAPAFYEMEVAEGGGELDDNVLIHLSLEQAVALANALTEHL